MKREKSFKSIELGLILNHNKNDIMSKKLTVQQEITTMYFLDLCSGNFLKGNWNNTEERRWMKTMV